MDDPHLGAGRYRMPVGFGPFPGPRQIPSGKPSDLTQSPKRRIASVRYLTDEEAAARLLPPGFTLDGEPVVTVEMHHMTEIDWLAGRGYAMFGIRLPVRYRGQHDEGRGQFLTVLWENLADPIISGREELGFAKLWCDIPEPRVSGGSWHYTANWLGFTFAEVELHDLTDDTRPPPAAQDLFHYKYVPSNEPGVADAAYATVVPAHNPNLTVERRLSGQGSVTFHAGRWEDLPTLHHIVSSLEALPILEPRGASLVFARGGKDLSDLRRLS
ncbi:acetoacetate decarboxylase family protein [Roseomonas xinghualingensis]|uniref:acetoacetate decarboxylase family protein n=1 Tax=Roseomonas xinghualingensis TaxID=2986475 RepID=UPI0021F114FF|nr:acetoacetate decarboxylase family protein [Roseomonas sp. SXEYE001]MCV4209192.1 acetoacetate decarboxylase family protein [Roseomonas sp. SXEYE001]